MDGEHRQREEEEGGECAHHLKVRHLLLHERGAERIDTAEPPEEVPLHGHLIREATCIESCLNWFHNHDGCLALGARKRLPIPVSLNIHHGFLVAEQKNEVGKAAAYMSMSVRYYAEKKSGHKKSPTCSLSNHRCPSGMD